ELIEKLESTKIYVVDIKGLLKRKPSFGTIKKLGTAKALWVEAGARTPEDCIDLIIAGAENVVLNPATISLKSLEYCTKLTKNIILKLEFDDNNEVISYEKIKLFDIIELAKGAQLENLVVEQKNLTQNIIDIFASNNLKSYLQCNKSAVAKISDWKLRGVVIPLEEVV
ncbi:MAG: hypothetical protein AB1485_03640, partial [Candidatus Thermoplasmatota archaeon]